ncbi:hypothetical protein CDL15_Pgr026768 [Punica granatum]|uniref:Uncharacterized protein n=1 Tax=Punica granatum TaxID=22663 RepID=A0A218WMF1_PUNGR|nr:hypothetical protein CDL15_Pgr026768 [Punica granatum]
MTWFGIQGTRLVLINDYRESSLRDEWGETGAVRVGEAEERNRYGGGRLDGGGRLHFVTITVGQVSVLQRYHSRCTRSASSKKLRPLIGKGSNYYTRPLETKKRRGRYDRQGDFNIVSYADLTSILRPALNCRPNPNPKSSIQVGIGSDPIRSTSISSDLSSLCVGEG